MNNPIFGWDLPPGVSDRDIDRRYEPEPDYEPEPPECMQPERPPYMAACGISKTADLWRDIKSSLVHIEAMNGGRMTGDPRPVVPRD